MLSLPFDFHGNVLPQDYEKYGVYEMRDKQALFRLIQSLGSSESLGLDADRHVAAGGKALMAGTRRTFAYFSADCGRTCCLTPDQVAGPGRSSGNNSCRS